MTTKYDVKETVVVIHDNKIVLLPVLDIAIRNDGNIIYRFNRANHGDFHREEKDVFGSKEELIQSL